MSTIEYPDDVANLIDLAHEKQTEHPRPHLGCSEVGHHCDRWIWLKFRWAAMERVPGRIKRLFRRGHLEELTIRDDMERVGIKFHPVRRVDFGSHLAGTPDAIVSSVPGSPKTMHLAEFKTANAKTFGSKQRAGKNPPKTGIYWQGVEAAKWAHYVQQQLYMLGLRLKRSLYYVVCKDDDRNYAERVYFNREVAVSYRDKGRRLAVLNSAPAIPYPSSHWQCKMCPAQEMCHQKTPTKEVNCRTCAHSTAREDSTWYCERHQKVIPYNPEMGVLDQLTGCDSHVLHPDLVPWEMRRIGRQWHVSYGGVVNGHPEEVPGAVSSKDLLSGYEGLDVT